MRDKGCLLVKHAFHSVWGAEQCPGEASIGELFKLIVMKVLHQAPQKPTGDVYT